MSFNLKNTFSGALVNTDDDVRYVKPDSLVKANNVDILLNGKSRVVSSINGNISKGGALDVDDVYIGFTTWQDDIYLFYTTDTDNYIRKYSSLSETFVLVARNDLSLPLTGDADYDKFVLSANVIQGQYLLWTGGIRQSNGDLDGYKEPARLHIADAIADAASLPYEYDNFSANLDKPDKLSISAGYNSDIKNNLLKYNSYIFYKVYTNKYNEQTVLSYPSDNVDVSYSDSMVRINFIDIVGFVVPDDIYSVDIVMSNDSSNTFFVIKTIDTTVNKSVGGFSFFNKNEYPVLGSDPSDIINYQFPLTATEQEVVDNRILYADVEMDYEFKDANGDSIDTSVPFLFATAGISSGNNSIFYEASVPPAGDAEIDVTMTFTLGNTYTIETTAYRDIIEDMYRVIISYTYNGGSSTVIAAEISALLSAQNSFCTAVNFAPGFTVVWDPTGTDYTTKPVTVSVTEGEPALGLNNDFTYKGGIVWLDDKGRNYGVTNVTDIFYIGLDYVFGVTTNLAGTVGVEAPPWATKYMLVRDKVNTDLNYSIIVAITVVGNQSQLVLGGYNYIKYLNEVRGAEPDPDDDGTLAFAGERGATQMDRVVVYNKTTDSEMWCTVPSYAQLKTRDTTGSFTQLQYLDVENYGSLSEVSLGDVLLYQPVKEVDSVNEVFYETSEVYTVTNNGDGTQSFSGDFKNLNWYDTRIEDYHDFRFGTTPGAEDWFNYPVMITDPTSLRDINHLGRGAYSVISDIKMDSNATLVHSQQYSPSTNYNGLGVFSGVLKNFRDLENKYGAVEKLYYDDTNLIIGQKKKWSKILINKSLLTSAGGTGTLTESKEFLNTVIPYTGDWGITDKQSFAVFGFRKYFVDENNKIMGRLSTDGVTVINASRDFDISEIIDSQDNEDRVIGGYDINKQEYIVCFESTGRVLRFSEYNKNQVGEYVTAVLPKDFITANKHFFTIGDDDNNLYEEGVGSVNNLYGNTVTNEIQISVNQEADTIKDYISISQHIDSVWALDTKIETLKNTTTIQSNSQGTAEWTLREDIMYADIRKDELSSGQAVFGVGIVDSVSSPVITFLSTPNNMLVGGYLYVNPVFPDDGIVGIIESISGKTITMVSMLQTPDPADFVFTKRDSIVEGESIKGSYTLITLTNNTTTPFELFSITTGVNISSHNDLQ